MVVIFSSEDKAIVMPVASIIATTQGRMPESIAFTPEYFSKSFMIEAMMNIITNEGNTTPIVAINPPMKPACDEPTKVRHVHCKWSRGGLRYGNKVHKFVLTEPAKGKNFFTDNRYHSISSAE